MLKALVVFFLVGFVVVDGFVRIKTTVNRGQRSNSVLRRRLFGSSRVNQTLIDIDGDMYYTGIIHVGTPPKEFVVDFDTGSPPLWLVGAGCTYQNGKTCKTQKNAYDLTKSSTGKDSKQQFSIQYGTGYAAGEVVSDIVGLTPNQTGKETKNSFLFGASTTLSSDFSDQAIDGLFGLSFSDSLSSTQAYIEYLRDNKVFEDPIFSVWLDRNASGHPIGGEIIFGGRDPKHCGDDQVTVPAGISKPWWTFKIDKVLLNGQEVGSSSNAITDTGTTFIYAESDVYNKIAAKYPLSNPTTGQPIEFECGQHTDIELTIQVGGKPFKLTADDLIDAYGNGCVIGIGNGGADWLLGDAFIKGYCQIHNYVDETLTLAVSKHPKLH